MKSTLLCDRTSILILRAQFILVSFAVLSLLSFGAVSEELDQDRDTHLHGEARFTLVVDRHSVVIDLDTSASSILGFHHGIVLDVDRQKLRKAILVLKESNNVVDFPPEADCRQIHSSVNSKLISLNNVIKNTLTNQQKDNAAFEVGYQLECKHPERIHYVSLPVFNQFQHLQVLHAQWMLDDKQGRGTYSMQHERVNLR
jgi:hypothetical protein